MSQIFRGIALLAFVIAGVLFIVGAVPTAGVDLKDIAFGLALAMAGLFLWCLSTMVSNQPVAGP
jgi:drug/metabolite transporter (DMT)-like permease